MMSGEGVTDSLVALAYEVDVSAMSAHTRTVSMRLIRDGIGVMYAGLDHPTIGVLVDYLRTTQPRSGVALLGHGLTCSMADAALVYGCAIHCLDFEPMFLPPTHAVSPVLAPLIAIYQGGGLSSEALLRAFIAGVQLEAGLRAGAAASDRAAVVAGHHFPFERRGFHPPGTVGPLGSALASSMALGLTRAQCAMAIGHAASRSSGISGNIGTMTKATHCGGAARAGLESALFVKHGLTASASILEARSGWAQVFGGPDFCFDTLLAGMRAQRCFTDPGFAFKRWPSHTAMQIAISGALRLYRGRPVPGRITVTVPVLPYCDRPKPESGDACRFSFQYNVAVALTDGVVDNESFTLQKLRSASVQDCLSRIVLVQDPDIPVDFGRMWVRIETEAGEVVTADTWPGHWKTPASEATLAEKFVRCTAPRWGPETAQRLSRALLQLTEPAGRAGLHRVLNAGIGS